MRGYTVVTSAVALEVDFKWLDNLLSHHSIAGVRQARQGVSRMVPYPALRVIAVTLYLIREAQLPLPAALEWGARLAGGENPAGSGYLRISMDMDSLDQRLGEQLAYAVEVAPVPRRGRPRIGQ